MSKRISIITVNLNNLKGLQQTCASVWHQAEKPFEHIVIDGASDDGSAEFIEANRSKFNCAIIEPDTGIYNAMNKGIGLASGDYIWFLNSGDTLFDNFSCSKVVNCSSFADIITGNLILAESGNLLYTKYPRRLDVTFFLRTTLPHQSTIIRKGLFDKIGLYNELNRIVSDWEFFMFAMIEFKASHQFIKDVLVVYDESGISSDKANQEILVREKLRFIKTYFPDKEEEFYYLRGIKKTLGRKFWDKFKAVTGFRQA